MRTLQRFRATSYSFLAIGNLIASCADSSVCALFYIIQLLARALSIKFGIIVIALTPKYLWQYLTNPGTIIARYTKVGAEINHKLSWENFEYRVNNICICISH